MAIDHHLQLVERGSEELGRATLTSAADVGIDELAGHFKVLVEIRPSFADGKVALTAGTRIGSLQVGGLRIDVRPRMAAQHLTTMIRYALGGGVNWVGRSAIPPGRIGLDELICLILAEEVEAVRKIGLSRQYVNRQERLRVLRGRPDFVNSFPWNPKGMATIGCRFHELTYDNLDNQLLRATLERATLMHIRPATRKRLLKQRDLWSRITSVHDVAPIEFSLARSSYTRLNEHYRLAHALGEIILARRRPDSIFEEGATATSGLTLSMPHLFERFLERLLRDQLAGTGVEVRAQRSDSCALLDRDDRRYGAVRPDLVLYRDGAPIAVVDAKYKDYWEARAGSLSPERKVSNADLYQMFFYAQRLQLQHGLPDTPAAVIVSPIPSAHERAERSPIDARYRTIKWQAGQELPGVVQLELLPLTDILTALASGHLPNSVELDALVRSILDSPCAVGL